MKVETDAILVCSSCGVEGEHELLYLSDHLRASRCKNCGATLRFSEHVYAEYAWDVAGRTARLPRRFVGDVFRSPSWIVTYPVRALRKPFSLFREISQVSGFERKRRFREVIRRKDAALQGKRGGRGPGRPSRTPPVQPSSRINAGRFGPPDVLPGAG